MVYVVGAGLMSRRKDRELFEAMQRLDSDYLGLRGYAQEQGQGNVPLEPMNCTVCRAHSQGSAWGRRGTELCPCLLQMS